jgi:AAA+ superfamily predicted ATPase
MRCPRCADNGVVCKAQAADLPKDIYVCTHCDALWTHPAAIGPDTFVGLDLYLRSRGIAGGRDALTNLDPTWDGTPPLEVLRGIVSTEPENLHARIRLAEALADSEPAEALEHLGFVLGRDPVNLTALQAAARAAAALGETTRAEGYARLVQALSGAGESVGPTPISPLPLGSTGKNAPPVLGGPVPAEPGTRARLHVVGDEDGLDESWRAERPAITLRDVAGMEAVKRRLQVAFLGPLRNPEMRKMYGKSLRGGLLLYGPPGCGKTFIARATAGELGAKFVSVGLSDVLDMYLGESERRLHEIFDTARRSAPAVLFFDEIDAIGQKRSQLRHSAGRNVVNQLLAELDGVDQSNDGVFVLAATNHPWDVDAALLRPGRLDRMVLVLPPDEPARQGILSLHLADRPAEGVDVPWIAGRAKDFSGADLAHLCESAVEFAMEASVTSGRTRPINQGDFKEALKEVRGSTRLWFDTARNYAMFANESGMYDELLAYMRANKLL